ncbi:DUF5667 domain-containing protein [Actinokineospora xionganensis]|uniref:DUF5667 domain-containing protein n=1 Tax=Actinokineospora xionganensis TaxID=2684470 RepID=UPI00164EFA85|nr:DUF5667 domain-containing protein [Actinokineospora xionganensis]
MESGSGPRSPQGRHERDARAGQSRAELPGFTDDDLAVVDLLSAMTPLTAPSGDARARMRAKVLAGLAEPAPTTHGPRPVRPTRAGRAPRGRSSESAPSIRPESARPGSGARGRFAVAAIAVLALVFSLAGMSLLLARDALPGDTLYAIKRTGEAAALGLTFGDEEKAFKHLQFATARITEIETLTQRYPNPADAPVGGYLSALRDFDNDASAGSRQLIALATGGDGTQLETLRSWADIQGGRLDALGPRLPSAAAISQDASVALLERIEARATALTARMACYQITSGAIDDIGAMPATAACERRADADLLPTPGTQADNDNAPSTDAPNAPSVGTAVPPPPAQPSTPGQPEPGAPPLTTPPPLVTVPPILGGPTNTTPPETITSAAPTVSLPLPLPLPTIAVAPLLPGLPGVQLG